jgi:hypothetical protein
MSEVPPADIIGLIQYLESKGIPCEYSPYGSFDYHYVDIHDVDSISISTMDEYHSLQFWIQDEKYEIDETTFPESVSSVQLYPNHILRLFVDPKYYEPYSIQEVFLSACQRHGWTPVSHENLDLRPGAHSVHSPKGSETPTAIHECRGSFIPD